MNKIDELLNMMDNKLSEVQGDVVVGRNAYVDSFKLESPSSKLSNISKDKHSYKVIGHVQKRTIYAIRLYLPEIREHLLWTI